MFAVELRAAGPRTLKRLLGTMCFKVFHVYNYSRQQPECVQLSNSFTFNCIIKSLQYLLKQEVKRKCQLKTLSLNSHVLS